MPGAPRERGGHSPGGAALVLGAVGVVFGDIGTSPLYAMQTVFSPDGLRTVDVARAEIYGVISLVFWLLTIVVTVKYVLFVMRADNDGEGGIMALVALLSRSRPGLSLTTAFGLAALGIVGAAL